MSAMVSLIIARLFTEPFIQPQIKEKKSKLRVTGLCDGNSSPVKFPVQKTSNAEMFPFDDVIMFQESIGKMLQSNKCLSSLDVSHNNLGKEYFSRCVGPVLANNTALVTLR